MIKTRLAHLVDVAEGDRFEPGDADMDAVGIVAARQFEFLALGRTRSDEDGIEFFGIEQLPHALDGRIQAQVRAHVDDVADFFIEHIGGKPECRNVGAHQSAGHAVLFEYGDLIAQRQQIIGHGQRRGPRADAGDPLAVFLARRFGQQRGDVVAIVGGDAFQPADGDRLFLDAAAAAGRFAGPVANAAQNAGEHVGFAIHHVGFGELALSDQTDVLGNVGVRRTGPLAIYNPMEVIRLGSIGRLHVSS